MKGQRNSTDAECEPRAEQVRFGCKRMTVDSGELFGKFVVELAGENWEDEVGVLVGDERFAADSLGRKNPFPSQDGPDQQDMHKSQVCIVLRTS